MSVAAPLRWTALKNGASYVLLPTAHYRLDGRDYWAPSYLVRQAGDRYARALRADEFEKWQAAQTPPFGEAMR